VSHGGHGDCLVFRVRRVGDESLAPRRYRLPCSRRGFRETSQLLLDSLAWDLVAEVTGDEGQRKNWPLMVVSVALMRGDNHGEVRKQYIHDWSTEPDRPPLRWRGNVHRAVAWLAEEEDHTAFQLDVLWPDGVERLAETYALERSNLNFEDARRRLEEALQSRNGKNRTRTNVKVIQEGPGTLGEARPDGRYRVTDVVLHTAPQVLMSKRRFDEIETSLRPRRPDLPSG
jgi:hypothetical protein